MLTPETHCEILSAGVRDRLASISNGFRLFVQLFSALVGGAVALRLQYAEDIPASFVTLSDYLAVLIPIAATILVGDAFQSWLGYRKKLSEVAGKDEEGKNIIPPPRWWPSSVWFMFLVMLISCVLFVWFNPLRG
jgi:hypothetical protein